MSSVAKIVLGVVCACVGFWQLTENPVHGCSTLILGGFMILGGMD